MLLILLTLTLLFVGGNANEVQVAGLPSELQRSNKKKKSLMDTAVEKVSKEYKSFQLVFGKDRLLTHFSGERDFHHSLQRAQLNVHSSVTSEQKESDISHNFVTCGVYNQGRQLKLHLQEQEGVSSVSTVFTSEIENKACFTVTANPSSMNAIDFSAIPVDTLEVVPRPLKIHHSVVYTMGLASFDSSSSSTKSTKSTEVKSTQQRLSLKYKNEFDLSKSSLVVSTNKERIWAPQSEDKSNANHLRSSTSAKSEGISSIAFGRRLQNALKSKAMSMKTHQTLADDFLDSHQNIYGQSLHSSVAEIDVDSCVHAFNNLHFDTSESNRVFIGNLHSIRDELLSSGRTEEQANACFIQLLSVLAADPETIDVRFKHPQRKLNHLIKGIVQAKTRSQYYPYLYSGLDGTGQVIGLADTGVDEYSCFFSNDDGSLVARSDYYSPTFDNSKRKVIQYIDYQDGGDGAEGHGTHCSGSAMGMTDIVDYTNHSGHAQGAKLAFFDMENSATGNFGFFIPMEDVLHCAYSAGAKISSNSYGGMSNDYDDDTLGVDAFSFHNSDYLALFAAGNEGDEGYYSLSGASIAKNSVGVGASESMDDSDIGNMAFFSSIGPTFDNRIKPDVVAPGHATYSAISSGAPESSCTIGPMSGTSMATPAAAGISAQIRQYFEDSSFWETLCPSSSETCTAFSPRGATIKALLVHSGEPMSHYNSPIPYCYGYSENPEESPDDACATCNGPNYGDCVECMPGYEIDVVYADCSGICVPEGTAEIRPEDIECEESPPAYSNDEAAASTREPGSDLSAGVPDMYQGFGRVTLPNILPLPGIQEDILIEVMEISLSSFEEKTMTLAFNQEPTAPLKVTLCWMDPVNSVLSAKMLLHDIDLIVEESYGTGELQRVWYGNKQKGDERNNVEQVTINDVQRHAAETYYECTIVVRGKEFTESDLQNVSLIITASELNWVGEGVQYGDGYDENELLCDGITKVDVVMMDNFGDGWDSGSRVEIVRVSDEIVVWNGTMTEQVTRDAYFSEVVCLEDGDYYVTMIQEGNSSHEMGVEIDDCFIHLSDTVHSAALSVNDGKCNSCSDTVVTLQLTGSPFSIPYGWKENTQYILTGNNGREDVGRLVMGINMDQRLCLADGEYHLSFDSIAESDDWIDPYSYFYTYADALGIGEYRIFVDDSTGTNGVGIDVSETMTIRVFDNMVSVVLGEGAFSASPSQSPTATTYPTAVPIEVKTVVSFVTNMDMEGLNAASFDTAAKEAFAEITASGIDGVEADGISDVTAVDITSDVTSFIDSSTESIKVTYVVTALEENIPGDYADISALVASIEEDMVSLFNDPNTSEEFVDLSISKGSGISEDTVVRFDDPVVDFTTIEETVVSTRSPTTIPVVNSEDSNDSRDVGVLIAVTVGILVGLVVIALVVFSFLKRPKSNSSDVGTTNVELSVDKNATSNPLSKSAAGADQGL